MDIAISSMSPLPMGGYPLEGPVPAAQGFGALLQGGDSSPPNGAETTRAGPSDERVQGGHRTGGDDLGAAQGTASQPLPPAAPFTSMLPQPPIPDTPGPSEHASSDGAGKPLPMPLLQQGGDLSIHKALVVAVPFNERFEGLGAPTVAPADNSPGLVSGSETTGATELRRTDAKVVALRMPSQLEGAWTDPLPKDQAGPPTVGGSGQSDSDVEAVHRSINTRPVGSAGTDAGEVQQNKDRQTPEASMQQPGTGELQRHKAKVVAAALLGRAGFEVHDGTTERPSDGRGVIEPAAGTATTQQQTRVLGKPISGNGHEQARQDGTQPTTQSGEVEQPAEQHGGDLQHHKATVVASRLAGQHQGNDAEAAGSRERGPGLQDAQQGSGGLTNGGTVTPTVSAVRMRPYDMTTQEAGATGRDSRLGTAADRASGVLERAQGSVRPAPVVTAVAAYGGSEVRAPAQPFPRLDYRF